MSSISEVVPELEAISFLKTFFNIDHVNATRVVNAALYRGHKDFTVDDVVVIVALHGDCPIGAAGRWLSVTIS